MSPTRSPAFILEEEALFLLSPLFVTSCSLFRTTGYKVEEEAFRSKFAFNKESPFAEIEKALSFFPTWYESRRMEHLLQVI